MFEVVVFGCGALALQVCVWQVSVLVKRAGARDGVSHTRFPLRCGIQGRSANSQAKKGHVVTRMLPCSRDNKEMGPSFQNPHVLDVSYCGLADTVRIRGGSGPEMG